MIFNRRTITKLLDLVNLQRHNDNYADIQTDLTDHEGRITGAQSDITTHKASTAAHAAEHVTYDGAVVGATNIKEGLDGLKDTLDNVIVDGGDGTQAAAAAVSVSGTTYDTLKDRVDTEFLQTNAQLADMAINPKSFGAIGDGESHPLSERFPTLATAQMKYPLATSLTNEIDQLAIQAAMDYCYSRGGGTVKLSTGLYWLNTVKGFRNALLFFRSGVNFKGDGFGSILKAAGGLNFPGGIGYFNGFSTESMDDLVENVILSDFAFDLNGTNNMIVDPGDYAKENNSIQCWNGDNVVVRNVKSFNNAGLQHFRFGRDNETGFGRVKVLNCVIMESGSSIPGNEQVDHSSLYFNGEELLVDGCTFFNTNMPTQHGNCAIENHAKVSVISNNIISGYTNPFILSATNMDMEEALYNSNTVFNCTHGFSLWNFYGNRIVDLKINNHNIDLASSSGHGLLCNNMSSNSGQIIWTDNKVRYKGSEIMYVGKGMSVKYFEKVVVKNSEFEGFTAGGLEIFPAENYPTDVIISGLELTNAVRIAGSHGIVIDALTGMDTYGIVRIEGSTVYHTASYDRAIRFDNVHVDEVHLVNNICPGFADGYLEYSLDLLSQNFVNIQHSSKNSPTGVAAGNGSIWNSPEGTYLKKFDGYNVTGWIIEKSIHSAGSNGQGNYIRYDDGTMICYTNLVVYGLDITTADGSMYKSPARTWAFPATFLNSDFSPSIVPNNDTQSVLFGVLVGVHPTYVQYQVVSPTSKTDAIRIRLSCTGRWK